MHNLCVRWLFPLLFSFRNFERQACAIEAAALHNPDRDVFVLFASPVGFPINQSDAFDWAKSVSANIKLLRTMANVHLRNVNVSALALNTPILELEQSVRVYRSASVAVHLADVVRLLVLYRYGGVYLDMDMITRRSFADLPPVFLASEVDELSNGAMGSTHDGFGHEFFHALLRLEFRLQVRVCLLLVLQDRGLSRIFVVVFHDSAHQPGQRRVRSECVADYWPTAADRSGEKQMQNGQFKR